MTTRKCIPAVLAMLTAAITSPAMAQEQQEQAPSETKIIIIEERVDRLGNTTRTKTVREGQFTDEEIDRIVEEELSDTRVYNRAPRSAEDGPPSGYLGVQIEDADEMRGALITGVTQATAADEAGLKEGDIITAVNGTEVTDADDLIAIIRDKEPGSEVEIQLTRGDTLLTVNATLRKRDHRQMFEVHREKHKAGKYHKEKESADRKPRLGVYIDTAEEGGVLVTDVLEGSLAGKAGLQVGDIITTFNGRDVGSPEDLVEAVSNAETGRQLTIEYMRDGKLLTAQTQFRDAQD